MVSCAFGATPVEHAAAAIRGLGGACALEADTFAVCSLFSPVLGREADFAVHVSPQAPAEGRNLVVLLHGAGRDHKTLLSKDATAAAIRSARPVILFPNGKASWWLDSDYGRYQSYVIELMARLAGPLHLSSDPHHRAVAGWSMGGFGSLLLIEQHPELFGAWAGLLALADFPNPVYPPEQNHSVPALFGPPERWPERNPLLHVEKLRGKGIWFATGAQAFDRAMNEALDRRLTELQIPHQMQVVPGGHEFNVVAGRLPAMLDFLSKSDRRR
jgi:S-formylglutathione hydrolase FrmB